MHGLHICGALDVELDINLICIEMKISQSFFADSNKFIQCNDKRVRDRGHARFAPRGVRVNRNGIVTLRTRLQDVAFETLVVCVNRADIGMCDINKKVKSRETRCMSDGLMEVHHLKDASKVSTNSRFISYITRPTLLIYEGPGALAA